MSDTARTRDHYPFIGRGTPKSIMCDCGWHKDEPATRDDWWDHVESTRPAEPLDEIREAYIDGFNDGAGEPYWSQSDDKEIEKKADRYIADLRKERA